ncbi:hypothetical protein CYY_004467 [Polysphondylium violaceum]|uniref:THH1/TOM1/TOM3 domain-containing protein n=1 Tax=Polysphondylium violaceum TaxID=133409 RepID=A0A8J4USZ9_9MYCE|nr:hypothetical protein CYY_004467 [Polysphondylium violaceum]
MMKLTIILLLLIGCIVNLNNSAPIPVSTTYQFKQVSDITNTFTFTATILETTFDQDINLVNSLNIVDNNKTLCTPNCIKLPEPIYNRLGTATLNCTNGINLVSQIEQDDPEKVSVPNGLIPFVGGEFDTFLSFADTVDWISWSQGNNTNKKKVHYLFFNDFFYTNIDLVEKSPSMQDIQNQNCKLYFPTLGAGVFSTPSSATYSPSLNVQELTLLSKYLQDQVINTLDQSKTLLDINFKSFQASVVSASDTYQNGVMVNDKFIDNRLSTKSVSFRTDLCGKSFNDATFSTDPCCNSTLLWTQCCGVRDLTVYSPMLATTSDYPYLVNLLCKNPTKSNETLLNVISAVSGNQNPITGCTGTYYNSVSKSMLPEYISFISTCNELIFGVESAGVPCTKNSDCYSASCNTMIGICNYPQNDPNSLNTLILQCHTEKMSSFLKTFLINLWQANIEPSQFLQLYTSKVVVQNCIGPVSDQFVKIKSSGGEKYVIANQTQCLSPHSCQFSSSIQNQADCKNGDYCVISDGGYSDSITYPSYCYYQANDEAECASAGGVWDPTLLIYKCTLPQYTTEAACLPMNICPKVDQELYPSFNKKRCRNSFCYNPGLTSPIFCLDSVFAKVTWSPSLNSGFGLCRYFAVNDEQECLGTNGGVWWSGRGWISGSRQTSNECETTPLCRTGDYLWLDRDYNSCTNYSFCSQPATTCYSPNYICYSKDIQTNCGKVGGIWNDEVGSGACYFYFSGDIQQIYQQCISKNYQWRDCSQLNNTQCTQCQEGDPACSGYYSTLQCQIGWRNDPYTSDLCKASGSCSDITLFGSRMEQERGCFFRGFTLEKNCSGNCMTSFLLGDDGNAYCAHSLEFSPIGCVNFTTPNEAECNTFGGDYHWVTLAINKTDCENRFTVCNEPNGAVSHKNPAQCSSCGGSYKSPFSWESGQWVNGSAYDESYWFKDATWAPTNSWGPSINLAFIEGSIEQALVNKFAPSTQSYLLCNYMPTLYSFNSIPCDCGGDPNTPAKCYQDGKTQFIIGVAKVCHGWSDALVSGPMELTVPADSVPREVSCIGIEASIIPASQFFRQQILSTDIISNSINSYQPSDVIVNENRVIVGQIVSDGIALKFTYNSSGQIVPFTTKLDAPMELCIEARSDISQHFPVLDFAMSSEDGGDWVPMEFNVTTNENGKDCIEIYNPGVYWVIKRINNWQEARLVSVFNTVQKVFLFIIGSFFGFVAIAAIYSLTISVRSSGFSLTIVKLINLLLFVFCLFRCVYLLLTAREQIGPNSSNLAGFYFLSELPIYLFLSIFSSLVFFWAELNRTANRYHSFMSKLKWPFIIANALMYIMFVIVISIFHSLDKDQQHTLRIIYSTIISCLCVLLIIGYWVYGGRLIFIQFQVLRIKNQKLNKNLKNMTIVLLISSVSLTLQIIFLFFNAFSKRVTMAIALVYYVIVELVPCFFLAYVFKSFKKKKTKKVSSSHQTGSTNLSSSMEMSKVNNNNNEHSESRSETNNQETPQ